MTTKIVELIYTEQRRGLGKEDDPVRLVKQLWTKEGVLVAEEDDQEIIVDIPYMSK